MNQYTLIFRLCQLIRLNIIYRTNIFLKRMDKMLPPDISTNQARAKMYQHKLTVFAVVHVCDFFSQNVKDSYCKNQVK